MVCSQCGAYAEGNKKYCSVCGAPLPADSTPATEKTGAEDHGQWSFVRAPQWPKPELSLDNAVELPPTESAYQAVPRAGHGSAHDAQPRPHFGEAQGAAAPRTRVKRNESPAGFDPQPAAPRPAPPGNAAIIGRSGDPYKNDPYEGEPYEGDPYEDKHTVVFGRAPKRTMAYEDEDQTNDYPGQAPRSPASGAMRPARPAASYPVEQKRPARPGAVAHARGRGSALRRGGKLNPLVIYGGAAGLVVVLLVVGIIIILNTYGSFGSFFNSVFGGSPITRPPEITETLDKSGVECYSIKVYAREGNTVTVRAGGKESSEEIGSSNFKIVNIPKNMLLPEGPVDSGTAEVTPDIRITTPEGEIVPVDIPAVTVEVPTLAFEIIAPTGSPAYVSRAKVAISGKVNDGSVTVTVEGEPLEVDENGNFSGEYTLPELGAYTLKFEARKDGYQIARKTAQVDYSVSEAQIELDKKTLRTATNSNKTTVKGTIPPGSTLAITAPAGVTADEPSVNEGTGAFTFDVQIDSEGSYQIDCVVTKDGTSMQGAIIVERAPDLDSYSRACQTLDYTRMTTEPRHSATYRCIGKVTEVVATEPYIIARLETDKGDIMFEYHGTAASVEANDGKTYNIYADYKGLDEETGLPLVYGWFIIKPSR